MMELSNACKHEKWIGKPIEYTTPVTWKCAACGVTMSAGEMVLYEKMLNIEGRLNSLEKVREECVKALEKLAFDTNLDVEGLPAIFLSDARQAIHNLKGKE